MKGMKIPHIQFKVRIGPDWYEETTTDYFKGKRVIVFSLPGAFTPICSSKMLPKYEELAFDFYDKGISDIYCSSVNDSFVMNAWRESLGIGKVKMIPDGSGEFTKAMDMLVDKPAQNFGLRSWRFAMVVNDIVVEKMFVEEGKNQLGLDSDPYEETKPEKILEYLSA